MWVNKSLNDERGCRVAPSSLLIAYTKTLAEGLNTGPISIGIIATTKKPKDLILHTLP